MIEQKLIDCPHVDRAELWVDQVQRVEHARIELGDWRLVVCYECYMVLKVVMLERLMTDTEGRVGILVEREETA